MEKTLSLKDNHDFVFLYNNGKYIASKYLVLYILPNSIKNNRLGITISKKVGKSVVRNRIKRLVKESYREFELNINYFYDMVFVVRKNNDIPSYKDIKKEVRFLLKKHGLLKVEI